MQIIYYIVFALWYLVSLLPLKVLYGVADLIYYPLYYVIRYRRKVVRTNLQKSFPEKTVGEIKRIEKAFYHHFCDITMETLKLFSISPKELKKRMTFEGIQEIEARMEQEQKTFCFVYLGHYGNWEWIASLPHWTSKDFLCAQIYHPLYNKAFDKLFLRLRSQHGGLCIAMKDTFRQILRLRQAKQKTIIGFISDQAPKWNSIHHWVTFLNQNTPVFIGTEKIGRQVDALFYFAEITRPERGRWHCAFRPMEAEVRTKEDFPYTDNYMSDLEKMINKQPAYWLWSHKRWKRTYEEWIRRQEQKTTI